MSMADFIGKFSEGYKCCYVCEIEEFETLPQGAKSGIYENTLLFGYTSTRTDLVSFLCFVVLSGKGSLKYEGVDYELGAGDCVFIDCRKAYSHSTSDDLWSLQWCHFYAPFQNGDAETICEFKWVTGAITSKQSTWQGRCLLTDHCCGSLPIIYVRCPYESELLSEVLLYFLGTNFRFFSFAIQ